MRERHYVVLLSLGLKRSLGGGVGKLRTFLEFKEQRDKENICVLSVLGDRRKINAKHKGD